MNPTTTLRHPADPEALQALFARRVVAHLNEGAAKVQPDVAERLRFAREQALARARAQRSVAAMTVEPVGGGVSALRWGGNGRNSSPLWVKIGSVMPLIVLVCGLLLIRHWHAQAEIDAAAEIDTALLADDLPPSAYSDPGFSEFLKSPRD